MEQARAKILFPGQIANGTCGGGCRTNRTFYAVVVVAVLSTFRSTPVLLVGIQLPRLGNVRIPRSYHYPIRGSGGG